MIYFIFCGLLGVSLGYANIPTGSFTWWAIVLSALGMAITCPFNRKGEIK